MNNPTLLHSRTRIGKRTRMLYYILTLRKQLITTVNQYYSSILSSDMSPSDEFKDSEASITENNVDRNIEAPNQTRKKLRNSDKKSMVYHKILTEILSDLKKTQNTGIYWRLKYPDGNYYDVKLYFPISMCVVDMKGARQLCGMYDTANVQTPSVSCLCSREQLHDSSTVCKPVLKKDMNQIRFFKQEIESRTRCSQLLFGASY